MSNPRILYERHGEQIGQQVDQFLSEHEDKENLLIITGGGLAQGHDHPFPQAIKKSLQQSPNFQ